MDAQLENAFWEAHLAREERRRHTFKHRLARLGRWLRIRAREPVLSVRPDRIHPILARSARAHHSVVACARGEPCVRLHASANEDNIVSTIRHEEHHHVLFVRIGEIESAMLDQLAGTDEANARILGIDFPEAKSE